MESLVQLGQPQFRLILQFVLACLIFSKVFAFHTSKAHPARKSFGPVLSHQTFIHPIKNLIKDPLTPLTLPSFPTIPNWDSKTRLNGAKLFLHEKTLIDLNDLEITSFHQAFPSGTTHIYLQQTLRKIPIQNAVANVNIDKYGKIISFGESLFRGNPPPASTEEIVLSFLSNQELPSLENTLSQDTSNNQISLSISQHKNVLTPKEGLKSLLSFLELASVTDELLTLKLIYDMNDSEKKDQLSKKSFRRSKSVKTFKKNRNPVKFPKLSISLSSIPVEANWVQVSSNVLVLTYSYELEMQNNWYHAHVCARTGKVLSLIDWVSDAIYQVYPLGTNDPDDGKRKTIKNPFFPHSSPLGWVNDHSTSGNNVLAQENLGGGSSAQLGSEPFSHYSPSTGHKRKFRFRLDLSKEPKNYLDAAITQLFYTNNILHDIFYQYGFNEIAGNFQTKNFNRGGKGDDPIYAYAQDGSGYNNANFAAPPDGKVGKMRMFVWNTVEPNRDGDLENGIIIHEFGHGVSTRLTGGSMNSGCLAWGESGGMGEGWGDVWATIFRMTTLESASRTAPAWEMGKYANGGRQGIRIYPYSSDMSINPSTYTFLNHPGYWGVHAKGEVWAITLLEVFWNLVEVMGFNPDWYSASLRSGNTLFLQLLIDGLKLQPCRPSFIDARDSILQAEQVLTQGEFQCAIWKGFARRGLGVSAERIPGKVPWEDDRRIDGFDIPPNCS